jgi:two-component system, NarL family, response regulator LiaR
MNSPSKIRLLLVDDHLMVRLGLATFLRVYEDLQLVGEASDAENAILLCKELHPDVVIMDMVMPDMDGAEATLTIRQQYPNIQVLILTSFKDEKLIQKALHAGAIGYLLKDVTAEALAQAIRAANSGHITLSPEAAQVLVHVVNQPSVPGSDLTEKERIVLALLVDGLNNTQIAARLVVSPSTIKSHVSNILAKLRVTSRAQAVALAVRNQLVP